MSSPGIAYQLLHSDAFTAELEALGLGSSLFGAAGVPAPVFQIAVSPRAGVFNAHVNTYGTGDEPVTFTRASNGLYRDDTGLIKTAAANVIRQDYDGNGEFRGLLLEPAKTNELTYSQDLTHANWTASSGILVTASSITAPDGTLTANNCEDPTTSGSGIFNTPRINQTATATNGMTVVFSVFIAKKNAAPSAMPIFNVGFVGGTTVINALVGFDPFTGNTGFPTGTGSAGATAADEIWVEDFGNWWRLSVQHTNNASGNTSALWRICPACIPSVSGAFDATLTGSVDVWQADLVETQIPGSPIVTTTAAATRAVDAWSLATRPSGFDANAGFLVVDFETLIIGSQLQSNVVNGMFSIATTKQSLMRYVSVAASTNRIAIENVGGTNANLDIGSNASGRAISSWNGSQLVVGVDVGSGFTWGTPQTFVAHNDDNVTNIGIDSSESMWLKNIRLFNRALTTSELGRIFAL